MEDLLVARSLLIQDNTENRRCTLWNVDPLLGNDRETNETTAFARQRPVSNSGSIVGVVFSTWSAPRLYHATDRIKFSWCSRVQWSEFSPCELLAEARG
jgi:hypothetical protein